MPGGIITIPTDQWVAHAIDLERVSAGLTRQTLGVLGSLRDELSEDIERLMRDLPDANGWRIRRLKALRMQANRTIGTAYRRAKTKADKELVELARVESKWVSRTLDDFFGGPVIAPITSPKRLEALMGDALLFGQPHGYWWKRQEVGLQDEFAKRMRLGVLRGEGVDQLVRRVRGTRAAGFKDGIMSTPRYQIEALVRTSVQSAAHEARIATYEDNDDVILGVEQDSTLDGRTTPGCRARDGKRWKLPNYEPDGHHIQWEPGIPVHFNCRSSAKPWMKPWEDLQPRLKKSWKEAGRSMAEMDNAEGRIRSSMNGPLKQSTTYEQFLRAQPEEFQQDVMGFKRWNLWKTGKLTQTDLVDQYSRPLSVRELEALIEQRGGGIAPPPLPPLPPPAPVPTRPSVLLPEPPPGKRELSTVGPQWASEGKPPVETLIEDRAEWGAPLRKDGAVARTRYEAATGETSDLSPRGFLDYFHRETETGRAMAFQEEFRKERTALQELIYKETVIDGEEINLFGFIHKLMPDGGLPPLGSVKQLERLKGELDLAGLLGHKERSVFDAAIQRAARREALDALETEYAQSAYNMGPEQIREGQRQALLEYFGRPSEARTIVPMGPTHKQLAQKMVDDGSDKVLDDVRDWFGQLSRRPLPQGRIQQFEFKMKNGRSGASSELDGIMMQFRANDVNVNRAHVTKTLVHEYGHHIEYGIDKVYAEVSAPFERAKEWSRLSFSDFRENVQDIGQLLNNPNMKGELCWSGWEGAVRHPYSAKLYYDLEVPFSRVTVANQFKEGVLRLRATEITSMGMEDMFTDPYLMAKDHPGHFRLILEQLGIGITPQTP